MSGNIGTKLSFC